MKKYLLLIPFLLMATEGCGWDKQGPIKEAQPEFGSFDGSFSFTWLDDGRFMQLNDNIIYYDPSGRAWLAPKDWKVNGASIPRVFWTAVGAPFEGQYRKASVVHDVYCITKTESSTDTHRMFYNACRASGVGEAQAKFLYWCVYNFGPQWEKVKQSTFIDGELVNTQEVLSFTPDPPSLEEIDRIKELLEKEADEISLEQLEMERVATP